MTIKKLASAMLFICVAAPIQAATINTVSVTNGGVGDPTCGAVESSSNSGSGPIGASYLNTRPGCRTEGVAQAFGGGVGIQGETVNAPDAPSSGSIIRAFASTRMTDIFIKPIDSETTNFIIDVAVNAALDGLLYSDVYSASPFLRSSSANVSASVRLDGILRFPFDTTSDTRTFDASVGVTNDLGDASEFRALIGILRPRIRHDWRQPLSVTFNLSGRAGAFGGYDSTASGKFDTLNTLSFSKTGPAFFLPDGFTVDAPELNIFNNRWVDPRAPVSPVPLPAGMPLLVVGLGALNLLRRRKVAKLAGSLPV